MISEKTNAVHAEVQSFEQMHYRLKEPIERYVFYLTGKRQDLEDVAQEIYIKLWINWIKIKTMSDEELKAYVFMIIRNFVINDRRQNNRPKRNKRMFLTEYSKTHTEYCLHDDILVSEGLRLHREAMDQLAKRERIVYMFHQDDYSADEIARILERSKCTVNNQLSKAYKTVKTYLNKSYGWNLHESGRKNCWKPASLN